MRPYRILYPFSLVYGIVIWLRNWFFDIGIMKTTGAGVPVISIGNITAGGTGKTPLTIEVAKYMVGQGRKVAVISRGYGRSSAGTIVVSDGSAVWTDAATGGDETVLIAHLVPAAIVIADEQRVRAAKKAVADFHAEVIVLDDGFQHRHLRRNIDIVVMDSSQLPNRTMLIPAGYRREPLRSLKRADAVIVTKVNDDTDAAAIMNDPMMSGIPHLFSSSYAPVAIRSIFGTDRQAAGMMRGRSVIAVSGIADPGSFERGIESAGARIVARRSFDDHHTYSTADVRRMVLEFRKHGADYVLTTEKDAVKLNLFKQEMSGIPVFALVMEVKIHQAEQWEKYLSTMVYSDENSGHGYRKRRETKIIS